MFHGSSCGNPTRLRKSLVHRRRSLMTPTGNLLVRLKVLRRKTVCLSTAWFGSKHQKVLRSGYEELCVEGRPAKSWPEHCRCDRGNQLSQEYVLDFKDRTKV